MRLNHLDILEQCFREKFRGYNKQEVDTFLHLVADDFKEMTEEIETLRMEIGRKNDLIEALRSGHQENPQNNNSNSQFPPQVLREKAKQIIRLAWEQAESKKQKAELELNALKKDIQKLKQEKTNLINAIKESALERLNQFKK